MEKTIDNLDRKILEIVMRNARIPSKDIALVCGVSRAAVHQRIQRLTAAGVILGSECIVNPAAVGYETCAYVGFYLREPAEFNNVISELRKIPEVVECHFTTGQYDIFVKLYARNNDHLLTILQDQIQALGLARTETMISFKEAFHRQVPVGSDAEKKKNGK